MQKNLAPAAACDFRQSRPHQLTANALATELGVHEELVKLHGLVVEWNESEAPRRRCLPSRDEDLRIRRVVFCRQAAARLGVEQSQDLLPGDAVGLHRDDIPLPERVAKSGGGLEIFP